MCGQPGTTFPGSAGMAGGANPPSIGGLPQQMQSGYGPYPGGWNAGQNPSTPNQGGYGPYPGGYNASPGGPLAGPPGMANFPSQAQGTPSFMGQMPPRQAPGGPLPPMGTPMVDPTNSGGFFGHPNHGGMPPPRYR